MLAWDQLRHKGNPSSQSTRVCPCRGNGSCLEKPRNFESCGPGFGTPGLPTCGRPAPNARWAAQCPASASALASWWPWQRVVLSPSLATASTWTEGGAETWLSGAASGTVSDSGAKGGRPSLGRSPSRRLGHSDLRLPASSCLCLQREELDSPRPRQRPGR